MKQLKKGVNEVGEWLERYPTKVELLPEGKHPKGVADHVKAFAAGKSAVINDLSNFAPSVALSVNVAQRLCWPLNCCARRPSL